MGRTTIRSISRFLVVGVLAATTLISLTGTSWAADTTHAAQEVAFATKINAERAEDGKGHLAVNLQLTGVARTWTDEMAAAGEMSHNPELAGQVEGDWTRVGENVGHSTKTGASPAELVERLHVAFMNSPGHRANVLGDFNQVGVGVRITGDTMWVTVNFMKSPTVPANGSIHEADGVADRLFAAADDAGRHASYVVVSATDQPGHALGAAALASDDAPLLFTHGADSWDEIPVLHPVTRAQIDRVLGGRGVVYVVGSNDDVSSGAVRELVIDGYTVKRLNGATPAATLARVAAETVRRHGDTDRVVIGGSSDWGFSVAAAMWAAKDGTPFLLTDTNRLSPETAEFLATTTPATRWVVGPRSSISDAVKSSAGATRVGGTSPAKTSVRVAKTLWNRRSATDGDAWTPTPGEKASAWAYTLAHAPEAAVHSAPALLVANDGVPAAVSQYLTDLDYRTDVRGHVRAATPVSRKVVDRVEALVSAL